MLSSDLNQNWCSFSLLIKKPHRKSNDNHHCKTSVQCLWKETKWLPRKEDGHLSRTILIWKIANGVTEWFDAKAKFMQWGLLGTAG